MRLPPEIRDEIYSYLLDGCTIYSNNGRLLSRISYATALFTVSNKISVETLRFFYRTNVFVSLHGIDLDGIWTRRLTADQFDSINESLALHVTDGSGPIIIFPARRLPPVIKSINYEMWRKGVLFGAVTPRYNLEHDCYKDSILAKNRVIEGIRKLGIVFEDEPNAVWRNIEGYVDSKSKKSILDSRSTRISNFPMILWDISGIIGHWRSMDTI